MTARQIIEARLGRPVRRKDGILLGVRGMTHDHIADAITAHYGPRCPDTEPGCPCCDAWAQYDAPGYNSSGWQRVLEFNETALRAIAGDSRDE